MVATLKQNSTQRRTRRVVAGLCIVPMIFTTVGCTTVQPTSSVVSSIESACDAAEYRQFDFWLGRWSVIDSTTGSVAGESIIERVYAGCVIRESWSSQTLTGGSLNAFDRYTKRWHQFWVDSAGGRREFIGGVVPLDPPVAPGQSNQMVLVASVPSSASANAIIQVRLTFSVNSDGTVRQYSDVSRDSGATWKFRYDYLYRRLPPA